jgi:hypothetical protein
MARLCALARERAVDSTNPAVDLVSHGADDAAPARRIPLRWLVAVLLVVAIAAGTAFAADSRKRDREVDGLYDGVLGGQSAVRSAAAQVNGMLEYTAPLVFRDGLSPELRAYLDQLLTQSADRGARSITAARSRVASIDVLPWHRRVEQARKDYLAYLDAQLSFYVRGGRDVSALFERGPLERSGSSPSARLERALTAFAAAAPDEQSRRLRAELGANLGMG